MFAGALLFVPPSLGEERRVAIQGVPAWLGETMEKSLRAVWRELSLRTSGTGERERVLRLVAQRLYPGYVLEDLDILPQGGLEVRFGLSEGLLRDGWEIRLASPSLEEPFLGWFQKDAAVFREALLRGLAGVPPSALGWGDVAFRDFLAREAQEFLPGWHAAPVVRLREERVPELHLSFTPQSPLVLALLPSLQSETLPIVLRQDLKEGMIKDLSSLVGLPVKWLELHREEVELWAVSLLGERNVAARADATLTIHFEAEQLSRMRVYVESDSYVIQGWLAGYAGSDEHYPELGLHVGKKLSSRREDVELYGEWIMEVNDFSLESRWGMRFSPWRDVLLGAEFSWPGGDLWWRLWADSREIRSPYLWWRYNPEGEHNGALGWRINEHFSLELHYDERAQDTLSIRAVGNL
jgi:hypothetical protein